MPVAATIIIKKPGAMTDKARRQIAAWMRKEAALFAKEGYRYERKANYHARYHYALDRT